MPRILHVDPRVPSLHGVLIKRQALDEQLRVYASLHEAKACVRRITRRAQLQAERLEYSAYKAGFQSGLMDSLNSVIEALADCDKLQQTIEQSIRQAVQRAFQTSLKHSEIELKLIDAWLNAGHPIAEDLHIVVPSEHADLLEKIKNRVAQQTGKAPMVTVGSSDVMAIQNGDLVFEFSPERTMSVMDQLVIQSLGRVNTRLKCQQWSAVMVRNWIGDLARRYGLDAEPGSNPLASLDELEIDLGESDFFSGDVSDFDELDEFDS